MESASEQVLQRFGPFGVSVCEGSYGIFRWHWENVFVIELTDSCLRGIREKSIATWPRRAEGAFAIIRRLAPGIG